MNKHKGHPSKRGLAQYQREDSMEYHEVYYRNHRDKKDSPVNLKKMKKIIG